ncbi:hypothetical protein AC249_AIPGENE18314 [Exaiptasia diaphana]|nr:hypothetical protein AC249_AIPGENE18314 [Exaiptasia diaphana]
MKRYFQKPRYSDDEPVESVFKDYDSDGKEASCKSLVAVEADDIESSDNEDFYQECSSNEGCSAAGCLYDIESFTMFAKPVFPLVVCVL